MEKKEEKLNLQEVRERLAGARGKEYWKSLDQVADTAEFRKWVDDEFPNRSSLAQIDRRSLLKYMGASMALAGLAGCRQLPQEKIVPSVKGEVGMMTGKPMFFHSAFELGGSAYGIQVECYEGRPVKIEGNSAHPSSLGATDAFGQAALLGLYDPDRSRNVTYLEDIETWDGFFIELRKTLRQREGEVVVLHGATTSPTARRLMEGLAAQGVRFVEHEPLAQASGGVRAVYDVAQADVIFSLDSDFLMFGDGHLAHARRFMDRRRVEETGGAMNRLYMVQSAPTITGAVADHTLPVKPSSVESIARVIAGSLGVAGQAGAQAGDVPSNWLNAAIKDLQDAGSRALVIPGENQPEAVHALARAINAALGSAAATYLAAPEAGAGAYPGGLPALVSSMNAGKVGTLIVLDSNPVYTAPADLKFADAMKKVKHRIHLGQFPDETALLCDWQLPMAHFLEGWGDVLGHDGTPSVVQPVIEPLHGGKTVIEVLAALAGKPAEGMALVQETWSLSEPAWRKALHDGVLPARAEAAAAPAPGAIPPPSPAATGIEVSFRPDPTIYDGRFANNAWLQELPKALTKLTWDNAFIISPATAQRLGIDNKDLIQVTANGQSVKGAALIVPGQADNSLSVTLGYGRTAAGRVGSETGFNAYALRTSENLSYASDVKVEKAGGKVHLALTSDHHSLDGKTVDGTQKRDIIRWGTLQEFKERPGLEPEGHHELHDDTLYNLTDEWEKKHDLPQWGMTVDLNTCIGCNACVTACQAENNIPVVGKEQVARGREMHWIRIDRYWQGGIDNPNTHFQPMLCMHCETAPCEPVCPVAATVHSHEGLNQMIYNRCIGTRYCSNNCPYKVRRFNFLNYQFNQRNFDTEQDIPLLRMLNNPEVSVRSRGVMEKCTYCVQRINYARIEAKKDDRPIRDGEVVPACAQVCPTRTIVFGNIADETTAVSRLRMNQRNYALLEELNTRPRTTYLAKVKNPNPEITA